MKGLRFLLLLFTPLFMIACEHKELSYDYDPRVRLKVVFNWQDTPWATPDNMSFHLFPKSGSEGWRYDFPNREGGTILIPENTYDILCYNNDSEVVLFRNTERWETFEVSTSSTTVTQFLTGISPDSRYPRAKGSEEERLVYSPDSLWCSSLENYAVVKSLEDTEIKLAPQSSVQTFRVEIHNVKNLEYASQLSAAISSMAGGMRVADGTLSGESVSILFGMDSNTAKSSIEGRFTTFGHCAHTEKMHQLLLYVIMRDGSKLYYTFDVTQKLHMADNTGTRLIVIDNLSLPDAVGDSSFNTEADEWESVEIDIKM